MSGSGRCPSCGDVLVAIELPVTHSVPVRDVSPPDAPLLSRVPESVWLLGLNRVARCS